MSCAYRMWSGALDFPPLDTSSTPLQAVTMKTISRHCQGSPEGQNAPHWGPLLQEKAQPHWHAWPQPPGLRLSDLSPLTSPQGTPTMPSHVRVLNWAPSMPPELCTPSSHFLGHLSPNSLSQFLISFQNTQASSSPTHPQIQPSFTSLPIPQSGEGPTFGLQSTLLGAPHPAPSCTTW